MAYYNFNNGNLNDSSGNGNNIIFNNAIKTTDRFGRANNAYLFNGTSNYMQVKNSVSLNPNGAITLMGIVKMNGFYTGICHANQIFQKGTVDQDQGVYSLRVAYITPNCNAAIDTSMEAALGFYGDYGYAVSASDSNFVRTNTWLTLVYTYDGQVSKFYVNGQLMSTVPGSATFTPNSNDLFIGRAESSQYPYWWNGTIDEIRIYNKALCEGAVKQLSSLNN
ncbi:MAG TPA: LamG domain-containing protein [Hanamia sp.]|nr:LamG domain-containing protein [Hanamia sp.]